MPNGDRNNQPSLLTTASILSYSGAAAAVTAIWTIVKRLVDDPSRWIAVAIALAAAVVIQILSTPLPDNVRGRPARTIVYLFLVLVNTAVLASAELGSNEAINPSG